MSGNEHAATAASTGAPDELQDHARRRPRGRRRRALTRLRAPIVVIVAALAVAVASLSPIRPGEVAQGQTSAATGQADPWRTGIAPDNWLLWQTVEQLNADMDAIAALGVHWIRVDFDWPSIEPVRGQRNWGPTDAVVQAAYARGINVLAMPAYTPAWARPAGTTTKHPPTDLAAWASFVGAAASRYRGIGLRAFEIWNEPNQVIFWEPRPDAAQYARVLAEAAVAIRAANPAAYIVTAGLAPAADRADRYTIAPLTFITRLYDAGARPYFDGIGMHPYSYPEMPLDQVWWNPFINLTQIRDLMVSRGDSYKHIWATEYGYPTVGPSSLYNEQRQAAALDQAMRAWASVPWTGVIFWFNDRDRTNTPTGVFESLGLRHHDGRPKPAWHHLAGLLGGS